MPSPSSTDQPQVVLGDALDFMRALPDKSVQLVAVDPPYFKVVGEPWDNQWDKPEAFLLWIDELAAEWNRVLTDNGTLYCWASPQMAARVQMRLAERFTILNEVVWVKAVGRHNQVSKESLRSFFPQTERCVVAEQIGADGSVLRSSGWAAQCQELHAGVFEPLRLYLVAERDRAGFTNRMVDEGLGTNGMAGHYFGASQWALPTEQHYERLREMFNQDRPGSDVLDRDFGTLQRDYQHLRREYEHLRREYEELRQEYEDLRRPFSVTVDVPYTDVWTFETAPPAKSGQRRHPCEKPLEMMRHIVEASTREGDVVLDCFAGSGSTAIAAMSLGRKFLGCDASDEWAEYANRRIVAWEPGRDTFRPLKPAQAETLFDL